MEKTGINIRKLRELNNTTQEYMAEQLSMSQSAYSRLEKGLIKMDITRLREISAILRIGIEDILNFDAEKSDWQEINVTPV